MNPQKQDRIQLTVGSRYHIRSMGSREEVLESEGVFKGMVSVGSVDALALNLGDAENERLRVIPSHVVLSIDILEAAEDEEKTSEAEHIHYT